MLLLCISLLMLSSALADESVRAKQQSAILIGYDRTSDTYSGIEDNLRRIHSLWMGVSVDNSTVSINETLPSHADTPLYLSRFAAFEENHSDLNVSIETGNLAIGNLVVRPMNASIWHGSRSFLVQPQDPQPPEGTLRSYHIELVFPLATVDDARWESLDSSASQDAISVNVRVRDVRYAVLLDTNQTLNPDGESLLNVTMSGGTVATVQFFPPSSVEVWSSEDMDLKASVGFSVPVYVETDDGISVEGAVNRTGKIRLA
jgi:hypothetical protein